MPVGCYDRVSINTPLIINDSLDLWMPVGAEGLHLGQGDGDVVTARKVLGSDKILGLSVDTAENIIHANALPIDYIGVGPVFHPRNKDAEKLWGLNGLRRATSLSNHPVIAIGGINPKCLNDVASTGVCGVAAIDAFHKAANPKAVTSVLRRW